MYRYIGNKTKLLPYIIDKTKELIGNNGVVADIMAGTGSVALEFKRHGYSVIASDIMTYSYHHLVVNLLLKESPEFAGINYLLLGNKTPYEEVVDYLNSLPPKKASSLMNFHLEVCPKTAATHENILLLKTLQKLTQLENRLIGGLI
jgi:adenine-specific DNA-methyltransferase